MSQTKAPATAMEIPDDLQYTRDHEWVLADGASARIGATGRDPATAATCLRVELPIVGQAVRAGQPMATLVFATNSTIVHAPLSGTVSEVNSVLSENPELINSDPFGAGWLVRLDVEAGEELEHLQNASAYRAQITASPSMPSI
jgi:glycine cleavage system H protein